MEDVMPGLQEMAPHSSGHIGMAPLVGGFVRGMVGADQVAANPVSELGHMGDQAQLVTDGMKYGGKALSGFGKLSPIGSGTVGGLSPIANGATSLGGTLTKGAEAFGKKVAAPLALGQMAYQTGQLVAHPEKIGEQADAINNWSGDNGHYAFVNGIMRGVTALGNAPATIAATGQQLGELAQVTGQNIYNSIDENRNGGVRSGRPLIASVYQPNDYARKPMSPR